MLGQCGRLSAMAVRCAGRGVAVVAAFCLFSCPVPAAAASAGSVIIIARIAPVRSVLVDSHNRIQQILSNTQSAVTPTVYMNSFSSAPVALTPYILGQYNTIVPHLDTHHTGVIYRLSAIDTELTNLFQPLCP